VDNPIKSPLTSISIGPGIRGIERGVERVTRLRHLAYVEIEAFIIENLVAQMEFGVLDPAAIWSDAKTCSWEIFRGIVDIIFAGYPCQPFSTAGQRKGVLDPRHLYPYIERAIRIIRPRICFFENVRGHVTCGLPEVIASLEGLGYRVRWGIYSAEETGATHKRERVFILAVLAAGCIGPPIGQQQSGRIEQQSELANTESAGKRGGKGDIHQTDGRQNGELQQFINGAGSELADSVNRGRQNRRTKGGESDVHGENGNNRSETSEFCDMGHSNDSGSQGWNSGISEERSGEQTTRANGPFARKSVARPGQVQHEWERPRTISYAEEKTEPSLGLYVNGYHFREDILRALGNSVYEDTAELAWRDLWRKFESVR
jgi:site-specific DNA-cytosine methylase